MYNIRVKTGKAILNITVNTCLTVMQCLPFSFWDWLAIVLIVRGWLRIRSVNTVWVFTKVFNVHCGDKQLHFC